MSRTFELFGVEPGPTKPVNQITQDELTKVIGLDEKSTRRTIRLLLAVEKGVEAEADRMLDDIEEMMKAGFVDKAKALAAEFAQRYPEFA